MSEPLVSVRVITYNHEKYIAQCLEGILMQRTNFPFETLVGEDCSSDRTREIVLDYQAKFPEKIRVITSEKNVGGVENSLRVHKAARGKYYAYIDGDDYWIDPLKLQKQFDFMEAHPRVSMCCHDAYVVRDDKSALPRYYCDPDIPQIFGVSYLLKNWLLFIPTASMFARNDIVKTLPDWRKEILYGDLLARLWCAHHGDIAYLPEPMSVYRVHATSMMAGMKSAARSRDVLIDLYARFNAETGFQYAKEIELALKNIEKQYRFLIQKEKWGRAAFFAHPLMLLAKLREYADVLRKYRRMYGDR